MYTIIAYCYCSLPETGEQQMSTLTEDKLVGDTTLYIQR